MGVLEGGGRGQGSVGRIRARGCVSRGNDGALRAVLLQGDRLPDHPLSTELAPLC